MKSKFANKIFFLLSSLSFFTCLLSAQEIRFVPNDTTSQCIMIEPCNNLEGTFVGLGAGSKNMGVFNCFLGAYSGNSNASGNSNLFVGYAAGQLNTIGSANAYIGNNSASFNTSGNNNTYLGSLSGHLSSGSNNIFLGYRAGFYEGGNNKLYISNSDTIHPLIYGEFDTKLLRFNADQLDFGNLKIRSNDASSGHVMVEPINSEGSTFYGEGAGNLNSGINNTFIGKDAGYNNTTVGRNTFIGYSAGYANTTGLRNTFVGGEAGSMNTIGFNNTFLGTDAGSDNTEGFHNTFIGAEAGTNTLVAHFNTFIGSNAGKNNLSGDNNTFIGFNAGNSNIASANNTFVGTFAGSSNITGIENTFIGAGSGLQNDIGNYNTMIGGNAGVSNTTGFENTFVGQAAGSMNTNGFYNTFIGRQAGSENEGGSLNTFIGNSAGSNIVDGGGNTFVGTGAGQLNVNGSGNIFIGSGAGYSELGSGKLYISNSDANAEHALIYGEFDNKLLRTNADLVNIKSVGDVKLLIEADTDNVNESDNPVIEFSQDGGLVKTFLGYDQDNFGANVFGIGSAQKDKILLVQEYGHVGINTFYSNVALNIKSVANDAIILNLEDETGANKFTVYPNGNATLAGTLTQSSDRRLKKNIAPLKEASNRIQQLGGYSYNWIAENSDDKTQIGVIAQEVQAVYPELVREDETGILSVNYSGLSAVLIEAVKEQQAEIDLQQAEIVQLKEKQAEIVQLKQLLESQSSAVNELMAEMKEVRNSLHATTATAEK